MEAFIEALQDLCGRPAICVREECMPGKKRKFTIGKTKRGVRMNRKDKEPKITRYLSVLIKLHVKPLRTGTTTIFEGRYFIYGTI